MSLMPFEEARAKTLARVRPIEGVEQVAPAEALGRVLAAPVTARMSVPNHDNSAMDGYAVRFADLSDGGPVRLNLAGVVAAGTTVGSRVGPGEALRIFTGAPVPEGCDCIVIQEVVERDGDTLVVPAGQTRFQNIRRAGQDISAGDVVFDAGHRLGPAEIGMLVSLGMTQVAVYRRLKVAVLSTGNEVQEPGTDLAPGQIYDSNRATLKSALTLLGVEVTDLGIARDRREEIAAALRRGAAEADVVLTSGGVSVGDFDLVKDVINELGAIDFWKVRMKPGKPQAHGRLGGAEFFGLPGNPVSVLVTYLLLVRPALLRMMGADPGPLREIRLPYRGDVIEKKHDRAEFLRGVLHWDGPVAHVTSTGLQGSGILSSMAAANVLIHLPEAPVTIRDGDPVMVIPIEYQGRD